MVTDYAKAGKGRLERERDEPTKEKSIINER